MIIRKKEHWFRMLFVWHGSVLPALLPGLGLLLILSLLVTYFHGIIFSFKIPLNPAPLTLFGFVLALFLGFRNNVSYDRFWEGRKLWGALLNTARSLTRQAMTLKNIKNNNVSVHDFVQLLSAFVFALKHQLRGTDAHADLKSRLNEDQLKIITASKYKPAVIMRLLGEWIQKVKDENCLDSIQQARFDENFDKLSDILGGCERIVSTPIPYSYRVLLHRTVYIYCFLLPFGLVDSLGWFTPLIVVFVAYTFVAFEAIADEIEEPFGTDANDLALNSMCIMIDETIHEMVGEQITVSQKITQNIID
ncbi:bestrophin family protein [Chryseobacterium tongliaoense]|uniref:bestrophin family protein n=1 Tax=Chryseobacterium tongliaoense TaxID=3240933 RepID=UPI003511A4F1